MRVSWCAVENSTHYFIEKESLDNPGRKVRWDDSQKIWAMPSGNYTRYLSEQHANSVLVGLMAGR